MNLFSLFRRPAPQLKLSIVVVVEPDECGYHAFTPGLRGLHADGRTEKDALKALAEVLPAYLQSLAKHGEPLPIGPHCTVEHDEVVPEIPPGAFLRHVTLQWPSLHTSGIS